MRKLRDISCALLMVLYMSHVGDSRLFVPDWDRGLEDCPVPSFENVKVSREVSIVKNKCKAIWKMSKGQAEERRAIRDLQVQEQAEVRPDRGADDEPMFAGKVNTVFCLNILFGCSCCMF